MEYEIPEEGEGALFDDSTNPSLKQEERESGPRYARRDQSSIRPGQGPSGRRTAQKGEVIPEEEDQS